jgi:hypothetical protein
VTRGCRSLLAHTSTSTFRKTVSSSALILILAETTISPSVSKQADQHRARSDWWVGP